MSTNPFTLGDISSKIAPISMKLSKDDAKGGDGASFSSLLAHAINASNDQMWDSGYKNEDLVTGKLSNTHDMAISGAKAEVMLHLTTQIASKLSSATTQLFQMQI